MVMMYLVTCMLSLALVWRYRRFALKHRIVDVPNARSSHRAVTARGGGVVFVGIWLSILASMHALQLVPTSLFYAIYYPVVMVALISCLDDALGIKARYRLVIHILSSMLALMWLFPIDLSIGHYVFHSSWLLYALFAFYLTWSINAYNFMDGLDGLAAFQSVFICCISAILLFHVQQMVLAQLHIFLAMAVLGFLFWNGPWPRARVFMGDVGSASLGFIMPLMSIEAQTMGLDGLLFAMLYLPFLFDTTMTLLRRILNGGVWYLPHREHAFQRLHRRGWPHYAVLAGLIVVDGAIAGTVLLSILMPSYIWYFFTLEAVFIGLVYLGIEWYSPMREKL